MNLKDIKTYQLYAGYLTHFDSLLLLLDNLLLNNKSFRLQWKILKDAARQCYTIACHKSPYYAQIWSRSGNSIEGSSVKDVTRQTNTRLLLFGKVLKPMLKAAKLEKFKSPVHKIKTQNQKADARPKCTNMLQCLASAAKLDKFYVCTKISTLVQHQQCYCWWCFKAANALQSYLALRCVVHHPSPNSAASTSTPPLCGAVPSTTTPGSNVNLLQINIWLWTNYNAFFAFALWEQVAVLKKRKLN